MKKLLVSIVALIVTFAVVGVLVTGCAASLDKLSNAEAKTYVNLSINPEVEFTLDENGAVLSVNCINEDAEVLLANVDLIGMQADAAAESIVEIAIEAGYIDVDAETNEVEITVIDGDEDAEQEIAQRLADRINRYFDNNGIYGKVSKATLEEYAAQAAELDIPLGKMKMVLRAIDLYPEMTLTELAAMEVKDLVRLIHANHKGENYGYTVRQEYQTRLAALKAEFGAMFALEQEIQGLEAQIATFAGTEEDKAALEQQKESKATEYEAYKVQYRAAVTALKAEIDTRREECNQEKAAEKQSKIEQNREKIQNHLNEFNQNKSEKIRNIQRWRNGNNK